MPFSHSISTPPPAHRAKPRPMLLPLSDGSATSHQDCGLVLSWSMRVTHTHN